MEHEQGADPSAASQGADVLGENVLGANASGNSPPPNVDSFLVPLQTAGDGCPLFLCYSVGGECLQWQAFVRELGIEHPVFGFLPREVDGQPRHYERLEDVATDCVETLLAARPQGPYCLAGYSFGGIVAYEMARQLREQGRDVDLLVIVDIGPAWHPPRSTKEFLWAAPASLWNFPRWLVGMMRDWQGFPLRRKVRQRIRRIRNLLVARKEWEGQTALRPNTEDFFVVDKLNERSRQLIPELFDAYLRYRPGLYDGRVSLFRARTWPLIQAPRHDLAWGNIAAGGVDVTVIPGGHSTILTDPYVKPLASAVRRKLSEVAVPRCP
jgi:thioesterase domain-containing protein